MAYRFSRDDKALSRETHRIFLEEIDSAIGHLEGTAPEDRDHRIHEARKSIKKIRALLRLVAPQLGKRDFQKENRRFRNIGRKISDLRDAQATIESFAALPESAISPKLKNLFRQQLESKKSQVYEKLNVDKVLRSTVDALQAAKPHLEAFSMEENGFRALEPGFLYIYRQGRKILKNARLNPSADVLHSFRKRVKDHWYHVRLLKESQVEFVQNRQNALRELETSLGEAHNLHVLQLTVRTGAKRSEFKGGGTLLRMFKAREDELSANALKLGESLYALKPRQVKRELHALRMPGESSD